jgi:hypothetical protein
MRIRPPSPAMVMALGALVISAGGTVTAAVQITSADIKDATIRTADIHDETIVSRDVDHGALTGFDMARNSLTGAELRESSLSRVPDANRLDGLDSTEFVRKTDSFTRHFSCAGTAWEDGMSAVGYTFDGSLKHSDGSFHGVFFCSADIPDGARVTEVSFSVKDSHQSYDVSCGMWRASMKTQLGDGVPMTGEVVTTGTPGDVRISDTTVDFPVIDNSRFSYLLGCSVGADRAIGLYGAVVTYRVSGG